MGSGNLPRRTHHQPSRDLGEGPKFMARMYRVLMVGFALVLAAGILNVAAG